VSVWNNKTKNLAKKKLRPESLSLDRKFDIYPYGSKKSQALVTSAV